MEERKEQLLARLAEESRQDRAKVEEYLNSLVIKRNRTSLVMNSFMHNVVDIENSVETTRQFLKWVPAVTYYDEMHYQKRLFSEKTSWMALPKFTCSFWASTPYSCRSLAFSNCAFLREVSSSLSLNRMGSTFRSVLVSPAPSACGCRCCRGWSCRPGPCCTSSWDRSPRWAGSAPPTTSISLSPSAVSRSSASRSCSGTTYS